MSRKDYEAIAAVIMESMRIIRNRRGAGEELDTGEIVLELTESLANALKRDNASFDRTRFMAASGF